MTYLVQVVSGIRCDQCDSYCGDVCDEGMAYGTCMVLCGLQCH